MIFVDPISRNVVMPPGTEIGSDGLPSGWFIPPKDISRDVSKEPLPYGVVLAFSSEQSYKKALKDRIDLRRS